MTLPIIPRVAVDPSIAIAPNAGQHDDAAVASQFSAALTMLLGHAVDPHAATATDEPTIAISLHGIVEGAIAMGDEAAAALATDIVSTHGLAGIQTPLEPSLESAADAAIDDATHQSLAAALANTLIANAPAITIAPDATLPVDTKAVVSSLDLLAPEFRDRLERVIQRMESEYGYKVEVEETYRSQARQDALFAQGRTEPGPVVTWTRASNHTAGRAADVIIDGSYDDPLPYERLMRIAREEGLRTLGSRDPGHIELSPSPDFSSPRGSAEGASVQSSELRAAVIAQAAPSVASQSSIVPTAQELESASSGGRPTGDGFVAEPVAAPSITTVPQPVAQVAAVARVATVSPVAQVATVAQVAQVAAVGAQIAAAPRPVTRTRAEDAPAAKREAPDRTIAPGGPALASPVAAPVNGAQGASTNAGSRRDGETLPNDGRKRARIDAASARDGANDVLRQTRDELMRAVATPDSSSSSSPTSTKEASGVGHADMSERIARLLKVQDAASDRPLSEVVLRLERPDGGEDRLRVGLRGNAINATIDVSDPTAADRLTANVKELQRSLERHGFETDSVTVRTVSRAMESSTLARAAGASVESDLQRPVASSSTSNTNTSSRERGARPDEQQQQRPSPDSQRQRSQKEQKGGRS